MVLEEWKPVVGFEGIYEISSLGRVYSLKRMRAGKFGNDTTVYPRFLKQFPDAQGYLKVRLSKGGAITNVPVHRLVAQAFIPNPDNLPCVNHKNEDKRDNSVGNLEWCSVKYNNNYGTRKERMVKTIQKPVIGTDENGVEHEFASAYLACEFMTGNYKRSKITDCCRGKRKRAFGWEWRYA